MIQHTNYITTPSGKSGDLKEISNKEFLVLLKFSAGKDYLGFYNALDSIISETIPDFEKYNIIDKAYTYLATCLYSVHNTIITETTILGPIQLSLTVLLNAIEMCYSKLKSSHVLELSPTIKAELSIPTKIIPSHTEINIDYSTGLTKLNEIVFTNNKEKIDFVSQISPKIALRLEQTIKKEFSINCTLFNNVSVNLILPDIFYLIMQVFSEKLDDYYEMMYYYFEYLKWSYDTFKSFTPLETRAMFNFFKEDKERQAEEHKKQLNNMR